MTRLEIDINYDEKAREYRCAWRTVSNKMPRIQAAKEKELAFNMERCLENYINSIANGSEAANG